MRFVTSCIDEDSTDPNYDPAVNCTQTLEFSVIGSDSCLFDEPVRPQPEKFFLNISSAERFEILLSISANIRVNGVG